MLLLAPGAISPKDMTAAYDESSLPTVTGTDVGCVLYTYEYWQQSAIAMLMPGAIEWKMAVSAPVSMSSVVAGTLVVASGTIVKLLVPTPGSMLPRVLVGESDVPT